MVIPATEPILSMLTLHHHFELKLGAVPPVLSPIAGQQVHHRVVQLFLERTERIMTPPVSLENQQTLYLFLFCGVSPIPLKQIGYKHGRLTSIPFCQNRTPNPKDLLQGCFAGSRTCWVGIVPVSPKKGISPL